MSDMELPDARARVERIGRDKEEAAGLWAHTGDLRELYEGDALAIARVLAELDRLPRLREALPTLEQLNKVRWMSVAVLDEKGRPSDGPVCRVCRTTRPHPCAPDCWIARLTAALETP